MTVLSDLNPAHNHDLQFYEDEGYVCDVIADFLADALHASRPAIAAMTTDRRVRVESLLEIRGIDVNDVCTSSRLMFTDAAAEADATVARGGPDPAHIDEWMQGATEQLVLTGPDSRIAAYGEVAELLWRKGHPQMALALENIWHNSPHRSGFQLLCSYPMGLFPKPHCGNFRALCAAHDHVTPTERYTRESHASQLRRISELEQHEKALEAELEQRRELESRLIEALRERDELIQRERTAREDAEAANRAKTDFLAVMNHELRTPLNAIAGYTELLEVGVAGPIRKEQREMLNRIQRSQRHLLAMIDEVLAFARSDDSCGHTIEDVSVIELVRNAQTFVVQQMRERMITMDTPSCDAAVTMRGDRSCMRRIVVNLLSNACKYSPEGGTVTVNCDRDAALVHIHVHDDGIGIAPQHYDSIFEPFFQVDTRLTRVDEGLGLGLAIARRLAIAMGGDITVKSHKGRGSTFTLSMPYAGPFPVRPVPCERMSDPTRS